MRILPGPPIRICDVDLAQEFDGALARLRRRETSMGDLTLGDLPPYRQDRVQGRGRILEDEADVRYSQAPQGLGIRVHDLGADKPDRAADPRGVGQEPRD